MPAIARQLSFDIESVPTEWPLGGFDAESDKTELLLLEEGGEYPYGYIPIYRDKSTLLLVMKRNRDLTDEQEQNARSFDVQATPIKIAYYKELVKNVNA